MSRSSTGNGIRVLVIETRDDEGQLMHLYYENGDQTVQKQIDPIRFFNLKKSCRIIYVFLPKNPNTASRLLENSTSKIFLSARHGMKIKSITGLEFKDRIIMLLLIRKPFSPITS